MTQMFTEGRCCCLGHIQWPSATDSFIIIIHFICQCLPIRQGHFTKTMILTVVFYLFPVTMPVIQRPHLSSFVSHSQDASCSLLLVIWFPTYSVRPRTQSHLLCSDTGEPVSPLCFPSHPLLCKSWKCGPLYFSHQCQASRMNDMSCKEFAVFKQTNKTKTGLLALLLLIIFME